VTGQGPVAAYFEHNNKSGCTESREDFDRSGNCWLFNNDAFLENGPG